MSKFLVSWKNFFESTAIECKYNKLNNLKSMLTFALNALNKSLEYLMDGESVFTTQFNTCCMETLPKEHLQNVWTLLKCIEQTEAYKFTNEWVENYESNNMLYHIEEEVFQCNNPNNTKCKRQNCCRIHRIGKSVANKASRHLRVDCDGISRRTHENGTFDIETTIINQCAHMQICAHTKLEGIAQYRSRSSSNSDKDLVTDSHYVTMLLLCWPYETEQYSQYVIALNSRVQDCLLNCSNTLSIEAKQLRQQILSLLSMISQQ